MRDIDVDDVGSAFVREDSDIPIQSWIGDEPPHPDKMDPISNTPSYWPGNEKPWGGLWTSSILVGPGPVSDWYRYASESLPFSDDDELWLLKPTSEATVLTIDSLAGLKAALATYGRSDLSSRIPNEKYLDFEHIANETDFDGIRLTADGRSETAYSYPGLNGWDTESTLWFSWSFSDFARVGPAKNQK